MWQGKYGSRSIRGKNRLSEEGWRYRQKIAEEALQKSISSFVPVMVRVYG